MNLHHSLTVIALSLLSVVSAGAQVSQSFVSPDSFDARPWCFWYWMHGAVTREGITSDLEAMAQNGLGGTYLMPIRSVDEKPELGGTVRQLSPEWYAMVDWAMQECDRLGLKLGMHICDGFALAGGPWITPEESMQQVVMTPVDDTTGTTIGYYSIPSQFGSSDDFFGPQPSTRPLPDASLKVTVSGQGDDLTIDSIGGGFSAKKPFTIDYHFSRTITASALELILPSTQFQAQRLDVYASTDGMRFTHVKQLVPARTGWQNYTHNTTHSIPTTSARHWRFTWTPEGTLPGAEDYDQAKWSPSLKVKEIRFLHAPRINQWEGKAGLVWRISSAADNTLKPAEYIPHSQVHRHSSRFSLPQDAGRTYFRLASVSTGLDNATGGNGKGLECDKFSRTAVRKQLQGWFDSHFSAPVPGRDSLAHLELARRILQYMHVDSWECGSQNWSPTFADEFKQRRGYDLLRYLPLMVGIPIDNEATSERILRDVRLTISELIEDVFFSEVRHNADSLGCRLSTECVCPTMVSDGMMHYRYADYPMGEFWLNSPTHDKINDMLDAISGGHIYGKRIIQAEGFTELRGVFNEDPAMLKPLIDRNFCFGINRLFYHVYCLNPDPSKRPGMTLDGIGLFFQKGNTWWDEGAEFTRYIKRCQYLLQMGRPVVDIAVYTGQEVPRRAFQPDRLVPMLPGIFGPERVKSEAARMANVGAPVGERPVGVKYCTNMLTPDQWINPLYGYQYDSFNEDALLRATTADGRFHVESTDDASPRYGILVLPQSHLMDPDGLPLSDAARERVEALRKAGVHVLDAASLPWTESTFRQLGIARDVDYLPDGVAYTHRSCPDCEIYFLSNQTASRVSMKPAFRDHHGRQPELWDAQRGTISRWVGDELSLEPGGSIFVVYPLQPTSAELLTPQLSASSLHVQTLAPKQWQIAFHDTGIELETDTLPDWSKSDDDRIRYYSGRATYTTTFHYQPAASALRLFLRLNSIANLATVRLNGKDCGLAWTAPYEVDITDALSEGDNELEIIVVNTWSNAVQGHDEGHDPFPNIWTNARYRKKSSELLPAGLFGPLEIIGK